MKKVVGFALLVLFLNSCGYKPTAIYTKNVLGSKIYADVETSLEDPENSILIKDAINEAIINKFHSKLVSKDDATSTLKIKLSSVRFQPIEYDNNGYVIAYKTLVKLSTTYIDKSSKKDTIKTTGDYDFNIESLSVISDSKRFNAIKEASQKAIDAFISKISIRGVN
jgi:hypothetical protein